jgi:hypothetical protein
MELSIDDADEPSVGLYTAELESAALDPRLRAYFLLLQGRASRRFGLADYSARFEIAREYAQKHRLHQLAHSAEQAMTTEDESNASAPRLDAVSQPSDEVVRIARALVDLRLRGPALFEQNSGELQA